MGAYGRRGRLSGPPGDGQRERLVAAMTALAAEHGWQQVSVTAVCARAGVSRRTFYELFTDREDCFAAAVERALETVVQAMTAARDAAGPRWEARVGAALISLLRAWEADRARAWVGVVEALSGSERTRDLRRIAFAPLAALVDEQATDAPPTGAAAVGAVLELAYRHLTGPEPDEPMTRLIAPMAFLLLAPHTGRRAALRHAEQLVQAAAEPEPADAPAEQEDDGDLRITELTEATILFLAERPGACNLEVCAGVGVGHESQMSRHLARLEHAGAAVRSAQGRSNAWALTALGARLAAKLRDARAIDTAPLAS